MRDRLVSPIFGIFLALGICAGCEDSDTNKDSGTAQADGRADLGQAPDGGGDTGGSPDGGGDTGGSPDGGGGGAIIAGHKAAAAFGSIPQQYFNTIRGSYKFYYGHTSHGSQVVTGLQLLATENGTLYKLPVFQEPSGDLGHNGDLTWEQTTRTFLKSSASAGYNVIIWSWCGGVSDNTAQGIDAYLNAMNKLESDFPTRTFVYMTGHTDGTGANGTLRTMNRRIRDYCTAHGKLLFDFEDIESWDPGGTYYPDITDSCAWCSTWCTSHTCPTCSDCAHSHCFNCYLKGKAFWWMMARVAGWKG